MRINGGSSEKGIDMGPKETSVNFRKYGMDIPKEQVGLLRRSKLERYKFLEPEETERILETVERLRRKKWERDYALIYCAANMGLRVSEVVIFNVEETLSTLKKFCSVIIRISKRKEGEDVEEYPVSKGVQAFLLDYADALAPTPPRTWLFPSWESPTGHLSTRSAERIFDLYCRMAGVAKEKSFHSIRHGMGVKIYRSTKDLEATRRFLRHRSQKTSQIYVHMSDDEMRGIIDDLPEIGGKK